MADRDELDERYEILELLGEGGMGAVYRARDRRLDREVAIKRLKEWVLDERAQTRLAREAQTLAQLSHPNVVEIYERFADSGGFALVMELIRGPTLAQWMKEGPHPWREVLAVFRQAASGLAAAHEAGVVHRDFKPANVMLGDDGRVRVMDFGVAKPTGASIEDEPLAPRPEASDAAWDEVLTATGMVVGTPAYMAPEQFQDLPADGRADQYALCVALWQALCGQRPHHGDSYVELGRAKLQAPPSWPKHVDVPGRLVMAIRRGLCPEVEDRWPSMRPLIDEFDAVARRPRLRRPLLVGAVVAATGAVAAIAAVVVESGPERAESRCEDTALHSGPWSPARRDALRTAVLSTGASYAAGTWDTLSLSLDAYAAQWAEARAQLCAPDAAADPRFDDRLRCLAACRDAFEAATQILAEADRDGLAAASEAVTRMPPLAACRDPTTLDAESTPADPLTQEQVATQRHELARVRSLVEAGRCADALAILEPLGPAVEQTAFAPVRGELRLAVGAATSCDGDYARAAESYQDAYFFATEQGLGSISTRAAVELVEVVGIDQERFDEAERWAEHASAELARRPDDRALARYHTVRGELHHVAGRYEDAVAAYRQSLAVLEKLDAGELRHRSVEGKMADSLRVLGRHDEALQIVEGLVEFGERSLGPEHPSVANHLVSLATLHGEAGDPEQAEATLRRAVAMLERIFDHDHPSVLRAVGNLAMTVSILGRSAEAIELHRRVIAGMEQRFGDDHANVAIALNNIGIDQLAVGDVEAAAASHRRALEIREQSLGMEHMLTASSLANLADVQLALGDVTAAERGYRRALPIFEGAIGREAFPVSYPLTGLGEVLNEQGRHAEALPLLERALAIRESVPCPPPEMLHTRFELARALYATDTDRARALELARSALELARGLEGEVSRKAELRAWLREHDG